MYFLVHTRAKEDSVVCLLVFLFRFAPSCPLLDSFSQAWLIFQPQLTQLERRQAGPKTVELVAVSQKWEYTHVPAKLQVNDD